MHNKLRGYTLTTVSRRKVIRTAGWTAPAVLAVTAIPAYAASQKQPTNISFTGNSRVVRDSSQRLQIRTNPAAIAGARIDNAVSDDVLTNITITYWLPSPDLTFSPAPVSDITSGEIASWSTPTITGNFPNHRHGAYTWYPYTMTYRGSLDLNVGTNLFGKYSFISSQPFTGNLAGEYYDYEIDMTINGEVQSKYGNTRTQTFSS